MKTMRLICSNDDYLPRETNIEVKIVPFSNKQINQIGVVGVHYAYGDRVYISDTEAYHRIRKNLINADLRLWNGGRLKDEKTIVIGLPYDFRRAYIQWNGEKLKRVIECLFRRRK